MILFKRYGDEKNVEQNSGIFFHSDDVERQNSIM